jgi:hypothetical protein
MRGFASVAIVIPGSKSSGSWAGPHRLWLGARARFFGTRHRAVTVRQRANHLISVNPHRGEDHEVAWGPVFLSYRRYLG